MAFVPTSPLRSRRRGKLYVDGTPIGTISVAPISTAGTSAFDILTTSNSAGFVFTGTVDEVAVGGATAKYSANFTPPTAPYAGNEAGLTALYHLDGNLNAASY